MDPHTISERKTLPVVHHDRFTESYYLHVINLYRQRVGDDAVHRGICEIANDRMLRQAVFKEDVEYCYETCMMDCIGEPAFF